MTTNAAMPSTMGTARGSCHPRTVRISGVSSYCNLNGIRNEIRGIAHRGAEQETYALCLQGT